MWINFTYMQQVVIAIHFVRNLVLNMDMCIFAIAIKSKGLKYWLYGIPVTVGRAYYTII